MRILRTLDCFEPMRGGLRRPRKKIGVRVERRLTPSVVRHTLKREVQGTQCTVVRNDQPAMKTGVQFGIRSQLRPCPRCV